MTEVATGSPTPMSDFEAFVVEAVRGALMQVVKWDHLYDVTNMALDAIPDGWTKEEGQWVETGDLLLNQEGELRLRFTSAYEALRADLAWCVGFIEQAGHTVPLSAKKAVHGCVCVDGCQGLDGDPSCDMRCGYCIHGGD